MINSMALRVYRMSLLLTFLIRHCALERTNCVHRQLYTAVDALHETSANVSWWPLFYTVFIDFTKALDLLQRDLIIQKLEETVGKESVWTRIIKSIIKYNITTISDNLSISDPIMQSNGVLQGDPMSPMLYILASEEVLRIPEKEKGVHIIYICRWYSRLFNWYT